MKPFLEALPWCHDSSLAMLDRRLEAEIPFQWHHHPQFELTLTTNSRGQRFIGTDVAPYAEDDLVLVGPNLPHTWVSEGKRHEAAPHHAQVIWFDPGWAETLGQTLVEFAAVGRLARRGQGSLAFAAETGRALRPAFDRFFGAAPRDRLIIFLDIICALEAVTDARVLTQNAGVPRAESRTRIDRVLAHLHEHFARPIPLEELADIAALSVSGLHRMFRRQTGQTISRYLIGLRLGAACAMLSGSDRPIAHVADAVGYNAQANFNRQFKTVRGMTPRAYRAHFRPSAV